MKEFKALNQIQVKSRMDLVGTPRFWRSNVKLFQFVAIVHPHKSLRHNPKMILMTKSRRNCFPLIRNEDFKQFGVSEISIFN